MHMHTLRRIAEVVRVFPDPPAGFELFLGLRMNR
jgi:hypothetical protein